MKFIKLTIQNFLSIKSISLDLENQGLVLLKGRNLDNESLNNNGAGKSSVIEALVYALYGRTLRGLKGDAVVHRIPKKNMKIFLDIEDDDGTKYRIARYRKHQTNKNKSFLYRAGKDITPKSEADFNRYIADLLQADYLTFTSSLLYSAESFKFTSATDSEMKETFDVMLGLDVYQKCLEITKSQLKSIDAELNGSQCKIEDRKSRIQDLDSKIESTKVSQKEFENTLKEKKEGLQNQIDDLDKELTDSKEDLGTLKESLEESKDEVSKAESHFASVCKKLEEFDELKSALSEVKDEIDDTEHQIRKQNRMVKDCKSALEEHSQSVEKSQKKIKSYESKKSELDKDVGHPCPTCGQPLTAESLEPAKQEYDELIEKETKSIEKALKSIENINGEITDSQAKIGELESQLVELNETSEEFEKLLHRSKKLVVEKENAEKEVQKSQKQFYKAESEYKSKKHEVSLLEKSLSKAQDNLKDFSENPDDNPYTAIIDGYLESKNKYQNEIDTLSEEIQDKIDEKECLEFWQQAYSNRGIKSFILDDITPFLNRRANKYLSKLTSGHIEVKFSTQTTLKSGETREKFSIDITNQDGGQEYAANSGGERKRVDLAINLAMQDLVASRSNKQINTAIFDEAFDALDDTGVEKVIELLQELSEDKSSIFVISHNEHLQSYFTNVVTVVKKGGFSTLGSVDELNDGQEEV